MSASSDTVLVSGAGISGLTLACALRHAGIDVEIVESKPSLVDDGGIGLTLVGNALRALHSVGLAVPVIAAGMAADHIRLCAPDGRLLREQPTRGPWGEGIPGHCSIARRTLHGLLAAEARQRGARIRLGLEIVSTTEDGAGIEVRFSDGSQARYALCAAAEGLYSATRRRLFPAVTPVPVGQASWRARVSRPQALQTTEIYLGGRYGVVGVCPISADEAYLYSVEAADDGHREVEARLHTTFRERLEGHYGGLVPSLLEQLREPSQVSYRPLPGLIAPAPWHVGRTVLIGDAAHANPPVLAQGAAMGIEDAIVLAESLSDRQRAISESLASFMSRRFERARRVVEASVQLARWEVEKRHDVDVGAVMAEVGAMLARPI